MSLWGLLSLSNLGNAVVIMMYSSRRLKTSIVLGLLVTLTLAALIVPWPTPSAEGTVAGQSGQEVLSTKPRVFSVMAFNDKVDTYGDELRLDVVLRTAHGVFDPNCAALGVSKADASSGCNLSFIYQFKGVGNPDYYRRIRYLNTLGTNDAEDSTGAESWAENIGQYFTVHKIVESGMYDYLVISIEANLDYDDTDSDPGWYVTGGRAQPFNLYAVLEEPDSPISCKADNSASTWKYSSDNCPHFYPETQDSSKLTNIMDQVGDKGNKRFMSNCLNSDGNRYCSGPVAFVGWNGIPKLWSKGQANWGLVTDYGLAGLPAGVAPPNSFFVYWFNVTGGKGSTSNPTCVQNTSFWFQWVALKNNSWVPVNDLTPQPVLVTGQSNSEGSSSSAAAGRANAWASFNEHPISSGPSSKTNSLYLMNESGQPMPAQREDGSIDFAKAKQDQDLDGYFKLVTWPVTTDMAGQPCTVKGDADHNVYNPDPGISDLNGDMDLIQQRLDTGWSVDTAFYKYDIPRPESPRITQIDGHDISEETGAVYASSLSPTVSGTCLPSLKADKPNIVTLFGEDPSRPVSTSNPDDLNSRGYELGRAECRPVDPEDITRGGTWSIEDDNSAYPSSGKNRDSGVRRYHAWTTEQTSGYDMSSAFSNIARVVFASRQDPSPEIRTINVPHTRRNEDSGKTGLPEDSKVEITGTVSPSYLERPDDPDSRDSILKVTARPSGGSGHTADPVELAKTSSGTFISVQSDGSKAGLVEEEDGIRLVPLQGSPGSWTWSIMVDPTLFTRNMTGSSDSETYTFEAFLTNPAGLDSVHGTFKGLVDMTPSDPGISQSDWRQVSGHARVSGFPDYPEKKAHLTILWPDGSSSETESDTSTGFWSIKTPGGLSPGNVQVTMTDAQGNESQRYTARLKVSPPLEALPFTGGTLGFLGLALSIFFLTLAVILLRRHRMRFSGLMR